VRRDSGKLKEGRITSAIADAAARMRDLNCKYLAEGKGATVTARFGPTASPSAIRTVRAKGRARFFRSFTSSQFELLSATIRHHQEPTLYRAGLDCFHRSAVFLVGEAGGGLSIWPSITSFPTLAVGSSALAGGL